MASREIVLLLTSQLREFGKRRALRPSPPSLAFYASVNSAGGPCAARASAPAAVLGGAGADKITLHIGQSEVIARCFYFLGHGAPMMVKISPARIASSSCPPLPAAAATASMTSVGPGRGSSRSAGSLFVEMTYPSIRVPLLDWWSETAVALHTPASSRLATIDSSK